MTEKTKLVLVLFLALSLLAETESQANKKTDKRGVLTNVGNDGKIGSRSSGDNGSYRSIGDNGSYRSIGDNGSYRSIGDSGSYRSIGDSGSYRSIGDSGSYRSIGDSGSYRSIGDSGSYRSIGERGGDISGSNADHLVQGFISGNGQARNGATVLQNVRVAHPIPLPQPVPVTLNRNVPVAVPQPYPVTVPKPYPVAVPHPVTVSVPRPYPVSVPRPVPVPVPHPVPVAVLQPVGVPVPKPYPVPVPHPVPIPSTFLLGSPAGGISFSGLGGDFLSLYQGAGAHVGGTLLSLAGSHGLTTGYGYGLPETSFSPIPQVPLQLSGFEPSTRGDSTEGNAPGVNYNSQEHNHPGPVDVSVAGDPAAGLSYVDNGKTASPPSAVNVLPPSSPVIPVSSADNYHYRTGYKV